MDYWEQRKDYNYYKAVRRLLESLGRGNSILDVGSANTPVATYGDFENRYRVDKSKLEELEGVNTVHSDWMDFCVNRSYSVVVCCQVIEHLTDDEIKPFVDKLFESGENVIISVPYLWPEDACEGHHQDPINLEKFTRLVGGRDPYTLTIENDSTIRRLVALFNS